MSNIVPNVIISMPSQLFTLARKFQAASNGKIFIGKIDSDPTLPQNQVQVYVENEDGSHVPVSQPIIINAAGYPVYNGQIAKFVTVQGHSMAVYDAYGAQQFYFPNVLKYDPDQLRSELLSDSQPPLVNDAKVFVHQPYTGAVQRTQHDKNKDVLNLKDFGAIGDGNDHPLSEIFSTLTAAQMVYPFVTSLSQSQDYAAWQSAINVAKTRNAGVFQPSGDYIISDTVVADYAPSLYGEGGQGLRDVSSTAHSPSPVRGTTFHSKVANGRTLSIAPDKYCFGLNLRDFAIWGVDGQCDVGLHLANVGWMGVVSGVNIQHFPNQGLELGYIQDTYFNNCSVLQCGNSTNFAVTCNTDSNYVYFNGCHFELTAYMFNINNCWNFSWSQCHFEVARPVGDGVTDNDRFYYISTAMNLGNSYRLSFSECTFIPVDAAYLATKLSMERKDVPYFMMSNGAYITFSECIWLAPGGSIDIGYFTGSHIHFGECQMISATPSKQSLYIQRGTVSNCTFAIKIDDDSDRLFGVTVHEGSVSGSSFAFLGNDNGIKRTSGFIITGSAICSGNEYQESDSVHKYLDNAATVYGFDGKLPKYRDINVSGDIDLTDYHPATQIRVMADNVTIGHIYGAPYGRDVIVTTNNTGTTIAYSSDNILTSGAVNYSLGQYRATLLKCLSAGISVLQQIG
ncbi:phage head-binding domain-containing protein [Escherichia coli]|uniref:phage head-binding domain-containing protein n=1 Tax=Escherichia coli TaxID=562 RepID=UPI001C6EFAFE|nr:phage head-binding domain-containing protein [Escherichia coli]MBW9041779.1 phage head-binding domain-containing protein [Escherichia coli]HBM9576565.1 phage head-binding domain-containing protein [Escherichia coli]HBM9669071.1 phage head-binding domain-containing protein [Escherichia coli]